MFCGIKKNDARSKKKEKKIQSMIDQSCYLRIVDKKSRMNYIKLKISETFTFHNQIIDFWKMITNENTIWFVHDFTTSKQRNMRVLTAARKHKKWKIKTHDQYKQDCANYYKQRVTWKYSIFLQIIKENYEKIVWFSCLFIEFIVIMIILTSFSNENYRKIIEKKNDFNEQILIRIIELTKIELNYDEFMIISNVENLISFQIVEQFTSSTDIFYIVLNMSSANIFCIVSKRRNSWISSSRIISFSND